MGVCDVHLVACSGAIRGAPLVLISCVTAPCRGILWAIVLKILGKPNVLPYGPWLSVAAIINLLIGTSIIGFLLTATLPT